MHPRRHQTTFECLCHPLSLRLFAFDPCTITCLTFNAALRRRLIFSATLLNPASVASSLVGVKGPGSFSASRCLTGTSSVLLPIGCSRVTANSFLCKVDCLLAAAMSEEGLPDIERDDFSVGHVSEDDGPPVLSIAHLELPPLGLACSPLGRCWCCQGRRMRKLMP